MIINRNHQTAAAVNLTCLYQIGTFGINFDYHVRCLNLESLSTGNVGCKQCTMYTDCFIKFIIE